MSGFLRWAGYSALTFVGISIAHVFWHDIKGPEAIIYGNVLAIGYFVVFVSPAKSGDE